MALSYLDAHLKEAADTYTETWTHIGNLLEEERRGPMSPYGWLIKLFPFYTTGSSDHAQWRHHLKTSQQAAIRDFVDYLNRTEYDAEVYDEWDGGVCGGRYNGESYGRLLVRPKQRVEIQ